MKSFWYACAMLTVLLALIVAACQNSARELPALPTVEEYRSWHQPTDIPLNYPIPGHADMYREIYMNSIGEAVEKKIINGRQSYLYPVGTIIVKEIYNGLDAPDSGEQPIRLTIMINAPEHPQALNGWLWLDADFPPAQPRLITHRICVDCHANANEAHPYGDQNPQGDFRDFVFFPPDNVLK